MRNHSYCLELGTILRNLPADYRMEGGVAAVMLAYRFGYADRLWNVREAMFVLFKANMERAESWGHGNRAERRAERLKAA